MSLALVSQGDGWKPVTTAWITGYERSANGPKRGFAIEKTKTATSFAFVRPLQSALGNVERIERFSAEGMETWLVGRPSWSLRLYEPSRSDLATWLLAPRFKPKDLTDPEAVSRSIGQPTKYLGVEKAAGRETYSMEIVSKPVEKILLDKETGLTLRFEQRDAGGIYYERQIETFELDKPRPAMSDPKRKVIGGIPNAGILAKIDYRGTRKDYVDSIDKARKELKSFDPQWVRTLPEIEGYEFKQTLVDNKPGRKIDNVWPANRLGGPELEPGGLPPGWSVEGTVMDNGTIFYSMTTPDGPGPRVLTLLPTQGNSEGSGFGITMSKDGQVTSVNFVSYIADDGRLVIAPGKSVQEAQDRRRARSEQLTGAGATVWTDFMTPTGDTVTFIQLRNRSWKSLIRMAALPAPIKRSSYEIYKVAGATIVSWRQGGTDYVLAGSALDEDRLIRVAQIP